MKSKLLRIEILERRRAPRASTEPVEVQLARARAMLIAAFGEEDFEAALALEEDVTAAEAERPGRHVSAPPHPPVGFGNTDDTR